jgi:acetate kinase
MMESCVLTINGGSSSIKFALYSAEEAPTCLLSGKVERIGLAEARFKTDLPGKQREDRPVEAPDHRSAGALVIDWIEGQVGFGAVCGIGHRVVHGGSKYSQPQRVTPPLLTELRRLKPYDPEHLPSEIQLIELFRRRFPKLPQVVCFDTSFHREMPRVARILPIPRRFESRGIERYGFHGLSYAYLIEELGRVAGAQAAQGRVVLAHLGNGASLAAVRDGKGIDTSMGFTPTAGVPMSSRSGDLDPGLVWYLARTEKITAKQFHHMVNHESGLLGVSETSPDMRDLLAREGEDVRAAEAVALFCYQLKKWIGGFAAALGGLETLVFAGGIGENGAVVRARICAGLEFLGVQLDETRNNVHASVISADGSAATVRVIRTNEEVMIAKAVSRVLRLAI